MSVQPWNLVADIGGTNARFGVEDYASSKLQETRRYSVSDHAEFSDALKHFLKDVKEMGGWEALPRAACFAVACAVESDVVQFTNSPWTIDRHKVSEQLNSARLSLVNDFVAVGHAVTALKPKDWHQIGGGAPVTGRPIAILGPGTGLGVCTLVPIGTGYKVIEGEGGHVDFAPTDAQEIAVFEILNRRFGRVSAERLLSGAGILNIYQALAQLANQSPVLQAPAEVTAAALEGVDTLALKSLQMFCRTLGAVAGNLALTLGAKGGVYIAGGIVPRFIDFLEASDFRHGFENKGRFRSYLTTIPTRVITKDDLGLAGAVKKLSISEL
ncbi:MAG: glucokinase [Gammaproteobacteria bacterium]|nr:glucokinase [Gammaproteobacteria bacterium]